MEHTRKLHTWGGFLLLLVLLVTFLIWNLLAGSVRLPASEIWAVLHGGGDLTQRRILLNIRLPRLLAAMILGGASPSRASCCRRFSTIQSPGPSSSASRPGPSSRSRSR